jgi:type I restriction enzyme R subunit
MNPRETIQSSHRKLPKVVTELKPTKREPQLETTSHHSVTIPKSKGSALSLETGAGPTRQNRSPNEKNTYVGDLEVFVVAERVQYYGPNGKLITESLRDYTRKAVRKEFSTLNVFLQKWTGAAQKLAIIAELQEHGVMLDELADEVGKDLDPFDLICHVAFDQPPLTRQERANNVKKRNYFAKYGEQARTILNALLDKYADAGIDSIEDLGILRVLPFSKFGTPIEIIKLFGGKDEFLAALQELEAALYAVA